MPSNVQRRLLESYTAQGASGAQTQATINTYGVLRDTRLLSETRVQNQGEQDYKTSRMTYDAAGVMTQVQAQVYQNGALLADPGNSRSMISDYSGRLLEKTQNGLRTHVLIANGEMIGQNSATHESFSTVHEGLSTASNASVSVYVVQNAGDKLTSVAKAIWGDERLWYLIADANGLSISDTLTVGQPLKIPAQAGTTFNGAATFKPYNAAEIIGNTTPEVALPVPQQSGGGCGGLGQLVMIVVAVAVTIYTGGMMGGVMGQALASAAGSVASQVVGNVIGAQNGFSWKAVATAAIGGAVTAGVASMANSEMLFAVAQGDKWTAVATRAAISNVISQGIGLVTGVQDRFSWRGVAASAVGSAVGAQTKEYLGGNNAHANIFEDSDIARASAVGFAAGAATAVARGGKIEIARIATDAFGNALGNSLAENTGGASKARDPFDATDMQSLIDKGKLMASLGGSASPMRSWSGNGEIMSDSDPSNRVYANEYEYQNQKNASGHLPPPNISAEDLMIQRVIVTGARLDPQEKEDWHKYQMRTSMPDFARAAPISKRRTKVDLSNPLLNAGITDGLQKVQTMHPTEVYNLRKSGSPIPGSKLASTDAIGAAVGFDRKLFYALGPNEISANLDRLQPYVYSAGKADKVDVDLINAIIVRESKGMQNAISGTGALGTSQLTSWIYGESRALGEAINPFNPARAVERQAEYLAQLSTHHKGDLDRTVAAYNQGQTPVDRAIKNHGNEWINHIHAEGREYVDHIKNAMNGGMNIPGYFGAKR